MLYIIYTIAAEEVNPYQNTRERYEIKFERINDKRINCIEDTYYSLIARGVSEEMEIQPKLGIRYTPQGQ